MATYSWEELSSEDAGDVAGCADHDWEALSELSMEAEATDMQPAKRMRLHDLEEEEVDWQDASDEDVVDITRDEAVSNLLETLILAQRQGKK
eukprot:2501435-Amphidinium_carterae.1